MKKQNKFCNEHVGIITLGCARNEVDSEKILADALLQGAVITPASRAETVIINTCGFTEEAKRESLSVIEDLIDLKNKGKIKKLIVSGCLSERYSKELRKNFKEVDEFLGIAKFKTSFEPVVRVSPKHYAYLKIAEGCANRCTYCAIPIIKGALRSRPEELILKEALSFDRTGVKELNIIGQDITLFGLEKKHGTSLPLISLLKKILLKTEIPWIRLLYLHPKRVTDELIELMGLNTRVCSYIDLPLQHINDRILKKMNRGIDKKKIVSLIGKIRAKVPGVSIRTTFIVGFPSETDAEFEELLDFVKESCFDKLGVFKYSREEDTAAFKYRGQISEEKKNERYNKLMIAQRKISQSLMRKKIGKILEVLIEEKDKASKDAYIARACYDAPEVDGVVYLKSRGPIKIGSLVKCKITDSYEYDLVGEMV